MDSADFALFPKKAGSGKSLIAFSDSVPFGDTIFATVLTQSVTFVPNI